jgi:GNAT superfamily N-acetyltransferase
MVDNTLTASEVSHQSRLHLAPARLADCDDVVALFGALHAYNASLDPHFALSDEWESLLRGQFRQTWHDPDRLWLLVKDDERAVGLLIAGIHADSPLFRHRRWVEVEAAYVVSSHRGMGLADDMLEHAYAWAEAQGLARVQLYVTACNERARSVYSQQGFDITQVIMRKTLSVP